MDTKKLKFVNIEEALELIGGYEVIYIKLIKTFLENQENLIDEINQALNADRKEARRLVHSCKGISKNLGASMLYEDAKDFELAILDENLTIDDLKPYFEQFKSTFNQTYQELIIVANQ